jgi:hypothetical protein
LVIYIIIKYFELVRWPKFLLAFQFLLAFEFPRLFQPELIKQLVIKLFILQFLIFIFKFMSLNLELLKLVFTLRSDEF